MVLLMSKAEEFKSLLPLYYRESNQMNLKCDSSGEEFDILYENIIDVTNQCFPQTATWGISFWEEFLGLPIDSAESLKNRRIKVINKMSRSSPMTPFEMRRILEGFADTVDIVQNQREYSFDVILGTRSVLGDIIEAVINEIEEIKPAHLFYSLAIKYITSLVVDSLFIRWESDDIPKCGTIDCSYNEYTSTLGKGAYNYIKSEFLKAFSELFDKVSEDTYILGNGQRLTGEIGASIKNLLSEEFLSVSEGNYIIGSYGKSLVNVLVDTINDLYSDNYQKVSENIYIGEVE